MAERLLVAFEGEGSGVDQLAWGQQQIWLAMQRKRSSLGIGGVVRLRPGRTVDGIAADLRFIMSRHPSLRTRLRFDAGGRPRQVLMRSGEVPLEIVDAAGADPARVAEEVHRRYAQVFDYVHEWPVRWAVIRQRGALTHLVSVICHLAADGLGVMAMLADLAGRDPRTGLPQAPLAGMQPLEQARRQRTPAARRQSDTALRYWEQRLRAIPARRFADSPDKREPRYWQACYDSPAADLAARAISARTGAPTSAVLLAAFAVALGRVTGNNPVVSQVLVSNRFRPGLAGTVSPVSQTGLCVIDVAGITFDEAVARAWRSAMGAYKHAYYDPIELFELIARVGRERGEEIDIECFVNDRRMQGDEEPAGPYPTGRELTAALRRSTLTWGYQMDGPSERFFFHINKAPPGTVAYEMCVDTHYIAPADLEACIRGFEAAVVEAAFDPAALTGIRSTPLPALQ